MAQQHYRLSSTYSHWFFATDGILQEFQQRLTSSLIHSHITVFFFFSIVQWVGIGKGIQ